MAVEDRKWYHKIFDGKTKLVLILFVVVSIFAHCGINKYNENLRAKKAEQIQVEEVK